MATVDQMERDRKRTVGKPATVSAYKGPSGGVQPGFSAAVQTQTNSAKPGVFAPDETFGDMAALWGQGFDQGLRGDELNQFAQHGYNQIYPNGNKPKPKAKPGNGAAPVDKNAPLMSALTQYATGMNASAVNPAINAGYGQLSTDAQARAKAQQDMIDQFYGGAETQLGGLNTNALNLLKQQYEQTSGEIGTQAEAGRTTIDESTQRALAALGGQSNPYANLQMADIGTVSDPMAAYSQAVGASQGGINALQQMLQSQNAATSGGFGNLAQLLGASNQAAQQSRIGDVNVARAGAQQDLAANQRAASLQALQQSQAAQQAQQAQFAQAMQQLGQSKLQSGLQNQSGLGDLQNQLGLGQLQANLTQGSNTQGRQDQLMQQLLGLAGQGIDISKIMALLGGQ
jgi:hypothetical protein